MVAPCLISLCDYSPLNSYLASVVLQVGSEFMRVAASVLIVSFLLRSIYSPSNCGTDRLELKLGKFEQELDRSINIVTVSNQTSNLLQDHNFWLSVALKFSLLLDCVLVGVIFFLWTGNRFRVRTGSIVSGLFQFGVQEQVEPEPNLDFPISVRRPSESSDRVRVPVGIITPSAKRALSRQ